SASQAQTPRGAWRAQTDAMAHKVPEGGLHTGSSSAGTTAGTTATAVLCPTQTGTAGLTHNEGCPQSALHSTEDYQWMFSLLRIALGFVIVEETNLQRRGFCVRVYCQGDDRGGIKTIWKVRGLVRGGVEWKIGYSRRAQWPDRGLPRLAGERGAFSE